MKEFVNQGEEFEQIAVTDENDSDSWEFTQLRQIMGLLDESSCQVPGGQIGGANEIFQEEEDTPPPQESEGAGTGEG